MDELPGREFLKRLILMTGSGKPLTGGGEVARSQDGLRRGESGQLRRGSRRSSCCYPAARADGADRETEEHNAG